MIKIEDSSDSVVRKRPSNHELLYASLFQELRTRNRFLQSLHRSRRQNDTGLQSKPSGEFHPQSTLSPKDPAQDRSPTTRTAAPTSGANSHRQETISHCTYPAGQIIAPRHLMSRNLSVPPIAALRSARAQALRAEFERLLKLATRFDSKKNIAREFQFTLPTSLFAQTSMRLRQQADGWTLEIQSDDAGCRAQLTNGVDELCQRFSDGGLGDLQVSIITIQNGDEPSTRPEERTSRSKHF